MQSHLQICITFNFTWNDVDGSIRSHEMTSTHCITTIRIQYKHTNYCTLCLCSFFNLLRYKLNIIICTQRGGKSQMSGGPRTDRQLLPWPFWCPCSRSPCLLGSWSMPTSRYSHISVIVTLFILDTCHLLHLSILERDPPLLLSWRFLPFFSV